MLRIGIAFIGIALSVATAQAASVLVIRGEALVSHGEGYERVTDERTLAVGDRVLANPGSTVKVTFSKSCSIFLGMGIVFSVPANPPCENSSEGRGITTGAAADAPSPPTQDWTAATQTTVATDINQANPWPYIAGAAAVGGAAVAIAAFSGGGDRGTPASP